MSDIATLLREEGWNLPSYAIGEYECLCPLCSHLRKPKNRKKTCAKVWIVSDSIATFNCMNCNQSGTIKADKAVYKPVKYDKPVVPVKKPLDNVLNFVNARGISKETAEYLGWFVKDDQIAFPFYKFGEIVNIKYRGLKEKSFYQTPNGEPVLYNYDNAFAELKNYNNTLIIVEGEIDCATMVEAGYKNCVSLPAGSDSQVRDKNFQGAKFDFLKTSAPLLGSVKRIILALDSDAPGQAMTQSLINMLPPGMVYTVDWTVYDVKGKDANDFWRQEKSIIKDAIDRATLVGGNKITQAVDDPQRLEQYMINGQEGGYKTGFYRLDEFITLMPGDFVTVTGYPGSGKSTWVTCLMLNMTAMHELRCLYCGFENPKDQIVSRLLQTLIGKRTFGADDDTIAECRKHYGFLNDHFLLLDDTAEILSVDALLTNIQATIINTNVDIIVIDPFNKLEFARSKDQSGDIGAVLNKLIAFAHKNKVLMFLVAHPTKPSAEKRQIGSQDIPSGFDIAGSANFQNMSDVVISVHRKQDKEGIKSTSTRVTVSKWRFGERGREGSVYFRFDPTSARFNTIDKETYDASNQDIPQQYKD